MNTVPDPSNPTEALAAVISLRRLADRLEAATVQAAINQGWTWQQIAQALGVTKQAVGPLLDELEVMGVVERVPDPADARAKLVRFSAKGREALMHGLAHLGEVEARLTEGMGNKRMRALHDALLALDAHLDDLGV